MPAQEQRGRRVVADGDSGGVGPHAVMQQRWMDRAFLARRDQRWFGSAARRYALVVGILAWVCAESSAEITTSRPFLIDSQVADMQVSSFLCAKEPASAL
jgi:hypothetical protein